MMCKNSKLKGFTVESEAESDGFVSCLGQVPQANRKGIIQSLKSKKHPPGEPPLIRTPWNEKTPQ